MKRVVIISITKWFASFFRDGATLLVGGHSAVAVAGPFLVRERPCHLVHYSSYLCHDSLGYEVWICMPLQVAAFK
jgi:hypothetical protein